MLQPPGRSRDGHAATLLARHAVKLGEQFPKLEDSGVLDELIPKKDKMVIAKWCAAARFGPATPLRDG